MEKPDLSHDICLHINDNALPVAESTHDLGVLVSCGLSLSLHASDIVAKAHKQSAAIHHTFLCTRLYLCIPKPVQVQRTQFNHSLIAYYTVTVNGPNIGLGPWRQCLPVTSFFHTTGLL